MRPGGFSRAATAVTSRDCPSAGGDVLAYSRGRRPCPRQTATCDRGSGPTRPRDLAGLRLFGDDRLAEVDAGRLHIGPDQRCGPVDERSAARSALGERRAARLRSSQRQVPTRDEEQHARLLSARRSRADRRRRRMSRAGTGVMGRLAILPVEPVDAGVGEGRRPRPRRWWGRTGQRRSRSRCRSGAAGRAPGP